MPSITRAPSGAAGRREVVERDVFAAVERLLADGESFTALGVQRIAEEAGIARTTFYGHFPDKPTLLIRMTAAATADPFAIAARWAQDDGTREGLERTLREILALHREHAALLRALIEVASYDPEVGAWWRDRLEGFAATLRRRLERDHRDRGGAAPGLDPAVTASWIAWGTERSIAVHVAAHEAADDPAFCAGVAAAVWSTMQAGAAAPA